MDIGVQNHFDRRAIIQLFPTWDPAAFLSRGGKRDSDTVTLRPLFGLIASKPGEGGRDSTTDNVNRWWSGLS